MLSVTPHAALPDRDLKEATLPDATPPGIAQMPCQLARLEARETMSCPGITVPGETPLQNAASTLPRHRDDVGQTKPTAG